MIELERQIILDAMVAHLEKRHRKYNKEMLQMYVDMKVPIARSGARPGMSPQPRTSITKETLRSWVNIFIEMYS
jgi:hypothetical protein